MNTYGWIVFCTINVLQMSKISSIKGLFICHHLWSDFLWFQHYLKYLSLANIPWNIGNLIVNYLYLFLLNQALLSTSYSHSSVLKQCFISAFK